MTRIVKEYALRRNEIIDAAERLVYAKGYEQMTIQDILGDLQISKGAFYHYFDSKQALLEALVERMLDSGEELITPIVQDPDLPAIEKFQKFYATLVSWKTAQKTFVMGLLQGWYTDDNAIVRQKVIAAALQRFTPAFSEIIHQGIQQGVFTTTYPDQVARVVLSLLQDLGDTIGRMLLSDDLHQDELQNIETILAVYTDALEHILGAPKGSLKLMDFETLEAWFGSSRVQHVGPTQFVKE
jgi:AcrR family transcriptional regulator